MRMLQMLVLPLLVSSLVTGLYETARSTAASFDILWHDEILQHFCILNLQSSILKGDKSHH